MLAWDPNWFTEITQGWCLRQYSVFKLLRTAGCQNVLFHVLPPRSNHTLEVSNVGQPISCHPRSGQYGQRSPRTGEVEKHCEDIRDDVNSDHLRIS